MPSPLTPDEAKRRISANVDLTRPHYFWSSYGHEYGGRVTPSGFALNRPWPHLRSRIGITVELQGSGSIVGVTIVGRDFLIFPIALPLFLIRPPGPDKLNAWILLVGMYLIMCLWYFFEKKTLIRDLERMLSTDPVNG
jgi:hypothetical protein